MRFRLLILPLFLLMGVMLPSYGQDYISADEEAMITQWESFDRAHPLLYDQFETADLNSPANKAQYQSFFEEHRMALAERIRTRDSDKRKAERIFEYLHEEVFQRYRLNTSIPALFQSNEYNCVTATAFFVTMAEAFDLPYHIYETPQHVYAAIPDGDDEIIVELTSPDDGFDFDTEPESVIQNLLNSKLITQQELEDQGAEELYRDHIAQTKRIGKKELLAIQYYNDGLILTGTGDYMEAHQKLVKALLLSDNPEFSQGFGYLISISQFDFSVSLEQKISYLEILTGVSHSDSTLTYLLILHLGERIEDLMDQEEHFETAQKLLDNARSNLFTNKAISNRLDEYQVYIYRSIAQIAALRGESAKARDNLQKALVLDPDNDRLETYYVSVTSNYALKLAQSGRIDSARQTINELAESYPEGYPVIKDAQVEIILAGLSQIPPIQDNADVLLPELEQAKKIQPENIFLKNFAAQTFHELAMQQIRRANYQQAKAYILQGLDYNTSSPTLRSDLELIEKMID